MKLISYVKESHAQLAILANGLLYDMDNLHPNLPVTMTMFLNYWEDVFPIAHSINRALLEGTTRHRGIPLDEVEILAPVPNPTSFRDGDAFRQHSTFWERNRMEARLPSDQFPVFYFRNHNSFTGPGEIFCMPDHFNQLDFGLQASVVICKPGKNIKASEADQYIGGYMILNSINAGELPIRQAKLNCGTAKGKDFATAIGPVLVTTDELEEYKIPAKENHTGNAYKLSMKGWVNNVKVSEGNLGDMEWTFAEMIEQCSYGVQLYPGDIIGSGPVGTGCFLELNNTRKLPDPEYKEQWLQEGDKVEMEIETLGKLTNTIAKDESDFSIFALKKI